MKNFTKNDGYIRANHKDGKELKFYIEHRTIPGCRTESYKDVDDAWRDFLNKVVT